MISVSIAVEGASDVAAVEKMLKARSVAVDPRRVFITRGKAKFDQKIAAYNRAAVNSPWLVLRDSDQDSGDCAFTLRQSLLTTEDQSSALCFRLAVRSLEAWLLADSDTCSDFFSVSRSALSVEVESLPDPKQFLVNLCRRSRRSDIRKSMVPPDGSAGHTGPEYVTRITEYSHTAWRPEIAALNAPSLARALVEVDRLITSGVWQ